MPLCKSTATKTNSSITADCASTLTDTTAVHTRLAVSLLAHGLATSFLPVLFLTPVSNQNYGSYTFSYVRVLNASSSARCRVAMFSLSAHQNAPNKAAPHARFPAQDLSTTTFSEKVPLRQPSAYGTQRLGSTPLKMLQLRFLFRFATVSCIL
ncbi:hypothetical protein TRVL_07717 [Trypanosoma vivax]|nr:hypothetical protein TRVL_07717 [Trypanosoma vivax]